MNDETEDWLDRTRPVDSVSVEVGFLIADDLGNPGVPPLNRKKQQQKALYKPAIAMVGDYAMSAAVEAAPDELVRYYKDVLRKMPKYWMIFGEHKCYFC